MIKQFKKMLTLFAFSKLGGKYILSYTFKKSGMLNGIRDKSFIWN